MASEAIARLASGEGLRACGALSPAGAEVEDGLAPAADALLDEACDRVNFHPLGAPAKGPVRWRVATTDDVDPERLLRWRFEQVNFYIEVVLLGEALDPREGSL